jgi:hypothetical protein
MADSAAPRDQQHRLHRVWLAMLKALAIYCVSFFILRSAEPRPQDEVLWIRYALSIVGIGLGGLSVAWRRRFLADRAALRFAALHRHCLITWLYCEAVGLCGVAAAFLAHSFLEYVPFGAAAAALLLLHRPADLPWGLGTPD